MVANRSLISSNTPTYVAGLLLGVLPIASCVIWTTLSIFSSPIISLCLPGTTLLLYNLLAKVLYNTSLISDDLPEPDTPVTTINLFKGISTETFFKLFSLAPLILIFKPLPFLLFLGTSIFSSPDKYLPVKLFGLCITSSGVPWAIT